MGRRLELFGFDLTKVLEIVTDAGAVLNAIADVKEKRIIKKEEVVEDVDADCGGEGAGTA